MPVERSLILTTPLGDDALQLMSFSGTESLSQLFTYHLEMTSEDSSIDPTAILGKNVTWSVNRFDDDPRYFNGFVSRFSKGAITRRGSRTYYAEVVPKLWFLTRTADCRIFQEMTSTDIIAKVLDGCGFSAGEDYQLSTDDAYTKREYCVQYRETSFNFISRLAEFEGIYYYFIHDNGKHKLVFADKAASYFDCGEANVAYSSGSLAANHISSWDHGYELTSGKWTHTDYNFKKPSLSLSRSQSNPITGSYEIYDYPGDYEEVGIGEALAKKRLDEIDAGFEVATGTSACCTFTPGGKFSLSEHDIDSENGSYVITSVHHAATEESFNSDGAPFEYGNSFTCIKASVLFRPKRISRRPFVQGVQTAVVTGPAGEEIYVDKFGRVKVQFYWDRLGKNDDKSSCWIRVSSGWAGEGWGFVAHPRIGQEVVVDFLEGNPDRPLITGRVYHATNVTPYALPDNKTMTTMKSNSSPGGGGSNELRFEDKKGSEEVYLHAQKDQNIKVENDESHTVGHDRTKTIDHDETTHVKHDRTETVDNDESITIKGNRTEAVEKDESITISGNRTETVDKDESITINGNRTETVSKDESITISGGRTESVSKDESITISGGRTVSIGKDDAITVGKTFSLTATDSITLTTGSASITMQKDGTITISGKDITINGSGEMVAKASKNMTLKGQKILQN